MSTSAAVRPLRAFHHHTPQVFPVICQDRVFWSLQTRSRCHPPRGAHCCRLDTAAEIIRKQPLLEQVAFIFASMGFDLCSGVRCMSMVTCVCEHALLMCRYSLAAAQPVCWAPNIRKLICMFCLRRTSFTLPNKKIACAQARSWARTQRRCRCPRGCRTRTCGCSVARSTTERWPNSAHPLVNSPAQTSGAH